MEWLVYSKGSFFFINFSSTSIVKYLGEILTILVTIGGLFLFLVLFIKSFNRAAYKIQVYNIHVIIVSLGRGDDE